jgi:hypothetical protein
MRKSVVEGRANHENFERFKQVKFQESTPLWSDAEMAQTLTNY